MSYDRTDDLNLTSVKTCHGYCRTYIKERLCSRLASASSWPSRSRRYASGDISLEQGLGPSLLQRTYLTVQAVLVDDPEVFRTLTGGVEINTGLRHHRSEDLRSSAMSIRCRIAQDPRTFVMMTSSSRGRSYFLIALPRIVSDMPLEYDYEDDQPEC